MKPIIFLLPPPPHCKGPVNCLYVLIHSKEGGINRICNEFSDWLNDKEKPRLSAFSFFSLHNFITIVMQVYCGLFYVNVAPCVFCRVDVLVAHHQLQIYRQWSIYYHIRFRIIFTTTTSSPLSVFGFYYFDFCFNIPKYSEQS